MPLRLETHTKGDIYVRFDDINDCIDAKTIFKKYSFASSFVSAHQFANAKFQDLSSVNEFEGHVKLTVSTDPFSTQARLALTATYARQMCEMFGSVRELEVITDEDPVVFRIEFDSIDAANRAMQVFGSNTLCRFSNVSPSLSHHLQVLTRIKDTMGSIVMEPWTGDASTMGNALACTAGETTLVAARRHPNDQHNRVRRERILDGSDIRTTVMLRNIPNKMDWVLLMFPFNTAEADFQQLTLKALLDKHCFGTYDFLYLRIDFNTGCNVGYAFVNFVDTNGMIQMLDNIEHRTWDGFRSSKAAEISYATIQGKEALVSKFRNSSVMQETAYCRPRLLVSRDDAIAKRTAMVGTELPFPAPDNMAKLHRSIDSARTTGLYPPNGTALVDHRARHGIYDNGNPRDRMTIAPGITAQLQRQIEMGFACANNFVVVPFSQIPREFIDKFLAVTTQTMNGFQSSNAGVIGQAPVHQFQTRMPFRPALEVDYRLA